jgi:putative colanic acid biosynthesis acetyltransferase WcaF
MTGSGSNIIMAQVDLRSSRTQWPPGLLIRRALWQGVLTHFAQFMPRPFNFLRIAVLRAAGARIGAHCLIMPGVKVLMPWNLVLDDCVAIGRNVELYNHARIRIMSNTVVSQYCFVCTSSHDYTKPNMPLICFDIEIGPECWIAAGAFVGPGVKIGNGAVIGARAVVTQDMPEWMICAGNPCRPIKPRTLNEKPDSSEQGK